MAKKMAMAFFIMRTEVNGVEYGRMTININKQKKQKFKLKAKCKV
jgi:hypothetical protein